jgi:hypothetical protein
MVQVLANAKGHQSATYEQPAGWSLGDMLADLPGPAHHFRGNLDVRKVAIRLALGKDMPKDHRQTTGNGDDRFAWD